MAQTQPKDGCGDPTHFEPFVTLSLRRNDDSTFSSYSCGEFGVAPARATGCLEEALAIMSETLKPGFRFLFGDAVRGIAEQVTLMKHFGFDKYEVRRE
jgi:hypothetical protein